MIPHPVAATAIARPDHVVLVTPEGAWTADALASRVARRAGAFAAAGLRPGDRVALRGPPDADFVVAVHALGWLGAVCLPVSWRATTEECEDLARHAHGRLGALSGAIRIPDDAPPIAPRAWPLEEDRLLVASSGTTGAARLIPVTTLQLLTSAFGSAIRLGHLPTDRWICALPLHHVGGLSILYRCAWYGTTLELLPRFDAGEVNRAIARGASLVSLVPTMLERVLDDRSDTPFPTSLRAILLGGAAAPDGLLARCRAMGAPVARTWGMTEAASQIATSAPGQYEGGLPPLPVATVEARAGRLVVRGPIVAGEQVTQDRGHVDASGCVHVEGRADAVIVSGGEKVDPVEVEQVLARHPAVREAAVVAVPDPTWGERPIALLVGEPVGSDELVAWCRASLSGYKVPSGFRWVDAIPRTELGKIKRRG